MSTPVRMVVIGAGVVGRMRASTIVKCPKTTLVAIADVDMARAQKAAEGTNAKAIDDPTRAVEMTDVDAVVVSTPGHLHEAVTVAALAAGKHVLCEKPLATEVAACERMVAAAAQAKRCLATGFNHRYYPSVKALRAILDSGRLGPIDHVRAFAGHRGLPEFRAEWMYKGEFSGGGAMMDIGIHMTDLAQFVAGEVVEVDGFASNGVWNVPKSEDDAIAVMRTRNGIAIRYQATWSEWKGYWMALEVYGHRGMAGAYYAPMMNLVVTAADDARTRWQRRLDLHPWINVREKLFGWETTARLAFADELNDFLALIDGRPTNIADGRAGLRAVAVAQAVYQSSAARTTVHLD